MAKRHLIKSIEISAIVIFALVIAWLAVHQPASIMRGLIHINNGVRHQGIQQRLKITTGNHTADVSKYKRKRPYGRITASQLSNWLA
ncbi:hypothetical protein MXF20_15105 [Pantoea dispersa]|uniref:hypothetical protein n=1 Tax=Pantoea dispersa TaxID=59814 RepID=UPI002DBFA00F|nr:hypothetical protein [Pantoea dispersa]MEB5973407.1 hypothetical protein [Pantoea dispersa]